MRTITSSHRKAAAAVATLALAAGAVLALQPQPTMQQQAGTLTTQMGDDYAERTVNAACNAMTYDDATPAQVTWWLEAQYHVYPHDAAVLTKLAVDAGCQDAAK